MSAYYSIILTSICVAFVATNASTISGFVFFAVVYLNFAMMSRQAYLRFFCVVFILFVGPLFFIHGILNANYQADQKMFDIIPVRSNGISFAAQIASKILVFFSASIYWLNTERSDLVRFLLWIRFPSFLTRIVLQSFVVAASIETRASKIILAQKSRGIDIRSSWIARFTSLPVILIPLVVWLFKEAKTRARIQDYTGSCNVQLAHVGGPRQMSFKESASSFVLFGVLLGNIFYGASFG